MCPVPLPCVRDDLLLREIPGQRLDLALVRREVEVHRTASIRRPASPIVEAGLRSGTADSTLPWSWYSDPRVLPRERERIFRRAWQYVGPAEHVAQPGQYFSSRIGDVPVLVARGRDQRLRAFLNVCRHRGAVLVEGSGRRETLQCQYHAWTYDLDGRLRTAPRSEREPGLDLDGIR